MVNLWWEQNSLKAKKSLSRPSYVQASSATSSAKSSSMSCREWKAQKCLEAGIKSAEASLITLSTLSNRIEKSKGEQGHPYLSPLATGMEPMCSAPRTST
jgi:hypothetical protein